MTKSKRKTRKPGGRQPGSGRPTVYGERMRNRITIWLSDEHLIHLAEQNVNVSEAIRDLIDKEIENAGKLIRSGSAIKITL